MSNNTEQTITFVDTKSPHNPHFREGHFTNSAGLVLHTYDLQPDPAKFPQKRAVVVFTHGILAHALFDVLLPAQPGQPHTTFDGSLVRDLVENGIGFYAFDLQSHGLSQGVDGRRGFVEKFDDFVTDLLQFTELVRRDNSPECTVFACGASFGGGITVEAARRKPDFANGMVLFAPMLSVEKLARSSTNRIMRPIGSLLAKYFPTAALIKITSNTMFPEVEREFREDPLCQGQSEYMSVRLAFESLEFCQRLIRQCNQINTPFLTFHSAADTLVDPDSSVVLFRDAPVQDKQFEHVDTMWHALLHEDGHEAVTKRAVEWVLERASTQQQ